MHETFIRGEKYVGLLEVGQRVYCGLYGGNYGVIRTVHGEQKPETIDNSLRGLGMTMGGSAHFDVIFDNHISRMLPECIIRGVQWEIDTSGERAGQDEINLMILEVERITKEKKETEAKEAEARAKERADLPGKHPFLIPLATSGKSSHATGAKNIKIELERTFPGVKFSVKSRSFSGGDSIDVAWEDGPIVGEVTTIINKYREGSFDGMNDIYEYDRGNVFPDVFGGSKYVHGQRQESVALRILDCKELGRDVGPEWFDQWGNIKTGVGCFSKEHEEEICQQIYRKAREMRGVVLEKRPEEQELNAGNGVTIRKNEMKNGIEVVFPGKPERAVIDSLKAHGFRWSPGQSLWYTKYTDAKMIAVRNLFPAVAV